MAIKVDEMAIKDVLMAIKDAGMAIKDVLMAIKDAGLAIKVDEMAIQRLIHVIRSLGLAMRAMEIAIQRLGGLIQLLFRPIQWHGMAIQADTIEIQPLERGLFIQSIGFEQWFDFLKPFMPLHGLHGDQMLLGRFEPPKIAGNTRNSPGHGAKLAVESLACRG